MKTVLVLNNTQMGQGDADLGRKLLGSCLRKLNRFPNIESVVLYNAGIKLATKGSPFAPELHQLQENGVDILVCGTCVEHYGLGDQIIFDRVSNMDEILATLDTAEKVITL
ncbi:MAG: DsrE family protein [Phycisphaerae bacterium]|nr:DsrE family protein [Phycisphaerae bacterium]